jgi:hypothetical protein
MRILVISKGIPENEQRRVASSAGAARAGAGAARPALSFVRANPRASAPC